MHFNSRNRADLLKYDFDATQQAVADLGRLDLSAQADASMPHYLVKPIFGTLESPGLLFLAGSPSAGAKCGPILNEYILDSPVLGPIRLEVVYLNCSWQLPTGKRREMHGQQPS